MSMATTCVTGQPVNEATRCGKSSRSQRELLPGSVETMTSSKRPGCHASCTASIGSEDPTIESASSPASRHLPSAASHC